MLLIQPDWPAPAGIHAFTTTRSVWNSLGNTTEESLSKSAARSHLMSQLQLPAEPIWLKQTHSARAVSADFTNNDQEADASFTNQSTQICLVLTADCLPLLICNRQGTAVAAIHAGWRGLANGVIENTIKAMNLDPADLLVWLGPAIGPEKFEVGADVYKAFTDLDPNAATCFTPGAPEKWLANLYQLAALRLNKIGATQIFGGNYCTHSQDDLFFSWRREHSTVGRMASLIWIDDKSQNPPA